jgi:hypothetical protein
MTLKGRGKQKKSSLNPRTTPMNEFWWICFFFLPPDNARSPRVTTVAWVVRECFPFKCLVLEIRRNKHAEPVVIK